MAEAHNLNPTDASNTDRFPEGQAPSTVNNGARALEGMVARWYFDTNYSVTSTLSGTVVQMTANRASITLTGTTSNYVADLLMAFTVGSVGVPGPCKVNINGIGPISLRDNNGVSLSSSALPSGSKALIVKDGVNDYFRLLSHVPALTYEVGTWTPSLNFGGGTTGIAGTQVGNYTKIGNRVFYTCEISLTNKGSSSGTAQISGLPFTSQNTTGNRGVASNYMDNMASLNVPIAYNGPNSSIIALFNFVSNALAVMSESNFTNTSNLVITGSYLV